MAVRFEPLITVKRLAELLKSKSGNLRVLDGSWHMPAWKRNAREEFQQAHIPGAQFFDIDACSDQAASTAHMLPSAGLFEQYVSALGITNSTHVVIYDNNEMFGLFSAQRVWWTFRVFGHNAVSVLDGGLPKWLREGQATTQEIEKVDTSKFTASFNASLVKSFEDVEKNLETKEFSLIDARPGGRFRGVEPEPRAGIEPGHIPASISLPFKDVLDPKEKVLKSAAELSQLFQSKHIDLQKPLVASCGSGVSACQLAFGAYVCGKDDVAVYDGAWTEWYLRAKAELIISEAKGSQ